MKFAGMRNRGLPHMYLSACKLWQVFLKACPQPTAHGSEAAWTSNSQALHSWFLKGQKHNVISRVCITIVLGNGPWLPIANVPLDKGNADSRNKINPWACMDIHLVWVCIDCHKDWNDCAKIMVKGSRMQTDSNIAIHFSILLIPIYLMHCPCMLDKYLWQIATGLLGHCRLWAPRPRACI